jgi:hypothetical protein
MPQNTVANQYYEAEAILEERFMGEVKEYLIQWKGSDQNGKRWLPTWVFINTKKISFVSFFKKKYILINLLNFLCRNQQVIVHNRLLNPGKNVANRQLNPGKNVINRQQKENLNLP